MLLFKLPIKYTFIYEYVNCVHLIYTLQTLNGLTIFQTHNDVYTDEIGFFFNFFTFPYDLLL